tara:strand:- start:1914 stop:2228 length:315 start_codon:yes stop_codon:yes gene_type:complete
MLKPKIYWKITSIDIIAGNKDAEKKKYLKFIISNSLKRYITTNNIKNLKNNIDFINLDKSVSVYSFEYMFVIKLKLVEKKIIIKNKKIIFIGKFIFFMKFFDLK